MIGKLNKKKTFCLLKDIVKGVFHYGLIFIKIITTAFVSYSISRLKPTASRAKVRRRKIDSVKDGLENKRPTKI